MTEKVISWDNVFELLQRKSITEIYTNPAITHDQLLDDLAYLREVIPDKFLNSNDGIEEVRLSVRDLFDPQELGGYLSLPWIHGISHLLRSLENIHGFKTFKRRFKSHRGMLNQLFATCYLNQLVPLLSIEQRIEGQDVDAIILVEGEKVFVHIKTIDQHEKSRYVSKSTADIFSALSKHPTREKTDRFLSIQLFDGIVPCDMGYEYWEKFIFSVPYRPGTYRIDFGRGYLATLTLDWTTEGKIRGPNTFYNFSSHLEKIEASIPIEPASRNVLLGVLGGGTLVSDVKPRDPNGFEGRKINAELFLHVSLGGSSFIIERTEVFSKRGDHDLACQLNSILERQIQLPFHDANILRVSFPEHTV